MSEPALVLYDGGCGLCHAWVRLLLRADPTGQHFRFAPLGGEKGKVILPPGRREAMGDTVVVLTSDDRVLGRTDAVVYVGKRLGGAWAAGAWLLACLPVWIRDRGYDAVARLRHRLFARPNEACPILPPHLRARFDE